MKGKTYLMSRYFTFIAAILPWVAGYAFFGAILRLSGSTFPRPARWLGRVSYSVYLMHPVVLAIVTPWAARNRPLAFMALIVGTLVVSDITFRLVERPLHHYGRALQKRDQKREEAARRARRRARVAATPRPAGR